MKSNILIISTALILALFIYIGREIAIRIDAGPTLGTFLVGILPFIVIPIAFKIGDSFKNNDRA